MTHDGLMRVSARWFRLLLRAYPADFRDELGTDVVDAYLSRARVALNERGVTGLAWLWVRALADAVRNGIGERLRPAASWRRTGNWGRDLELARRRLWRSPVFVVATLGTLTVGLGAFAVVYTAVDKILLERMAYRDPDDLYFVWRDQSASGGVSRDWLAGPDVADLQNAGGVIESAVGMQLSVPTISTRPDGEPQQTLLMLTSPHLLDLLGVTPMLGRGFAADEIGPKRPPVIVMSHGTSRQRSVDRRVTGLAERIAVHGDWRHGARFSVRSAFHARSTAGTRDLHPVRLSSPRSGPGSTGRRNVCCAGPRARRHDT
jgi:putative ABC transport system permease protein